MNNNTNEKIAKLTAMYRDRKLPREERQQAMEELKWEKYRSDPRPSMSLRKFKMLDGIVFLGDTFIFSYIGLADKHHPLGAGDIVMAAVTVMLIAMVIVYLRIHSKYKIEPTDELADRNLSRASRFALLTIAFTLVAAALILSLLNPDGSLTIQNNKMLNIICAAMFFSSFLTNTIFVMLEGKEEKEEE